MTDVMPETSNRFAVVIGRVLHPFLLPIGLPPINW